MLPHTTPNYIFIAPQYSSIVVPLSFPYRANVSQPFQHFQSISTLYDQYM